MTTIDILIVLVFVAFSVTAGFRARRRASKNLDEYYLAGRNIKGWRAGLSMAATQFAADTPLLFCGLIATSGVFALWRFWVYALAFLLMGFLFAAFWRRAKILTDAELVEVRYSGNLRLPLRLTKAIYFGIVINSVTLGFVLLAAFQVSELFLPWHTWLPGALYQPVLDSTRWMGLGFATGAAPYGADLAQRFMACSADREARIAAVVFSWVQILGRSLVWLVIGVALLALYPFSPADTLEPSFTASRERTFLLGISDFLPNGARGLMITALLAALASTIDTHLNWGSSYLTNDLYKRFVCQFWLKRAPRSRELVLVADPCFSRLSGYRNFCCASPGTPG